MLCSISWQGFCPTYTAQKLQITWKWHTDMGQPTSQQYTYQLWEAEEENTCLLLSA